MPHDSYADPAHVPDLDDAEHGVRCSQWAWGMVGLLERDPGCTTKEAGGPQSRLTA